MKTKIELPQEVISFLNKNTMFNMVGLVNLASLKASTECTIDDRTLRRLIQKRFGPELVTGKVEFTKPKKIIQNCGFKNLVD